MNRLLLCLLTVSLFLVGAAHAQDRTGTRQELRDHTTVKGANVKLHDNGDGTVSEVVYSVGGGSGGGASATGAQNVAGAAITTSTTPGTLVIARPTRRSCLVRNTDASIGVKIGPVGGVLMPLKAGESVPITAVTLWQVVADSGTPVVVVLDEYD